LGPPAPDTDGQRSNPFCSSGLCRAVGRVQPPVAAAGETAAQGPHLYGPLGAGKGGQGIQALTQLRSRADGVEPALDRRSGLIDDAAPVHDVGEPSGR